MRSGKENQTPLTLKGCSVPDVHLTTLVPDRSGRSLTRSLIASLGPAAAQRDEPKESRQIKALRENNTGWLLKVGPLLNQLHNYARGKYVMRGNDCSLAYCNQKENWTSDSFWLRPTICYSEMTRGGGRGWSHAGEMMFIFRLHHLMNKNQLSKKPLSGVLLLYQNIRFPFLK